MREPAGYSAFDGELLQNDCIMPSQVEAHRSLTGEQRLAMAVIADAVEVALGQRSAKGHVAGNFLAEWIRVRTRDRATRRKVLDRWQRRRLVAGRSEALHFLASNLGAFWFAVARIEHAAVREWAVRELEGGMASRRLRRAS